jgi:hypothetical protein
LYTKLTAGESNVNCLVAVPTTDATVSAGIAVAIDGPFWHATVVELDHDVVKHITSSAIAVGLIIL